MKQISHKTIESHLVQGVYRSVRANSLADAANQISLETGYFVLLLAMDATGISNEKLLEGAEQLLRKGAVYVCAWGPDCERVHDCFDEIIASKALESSDKVIMTTWHSKEGLEDALWFFLNVAYPDDAFKPDCRQWIAVAIQNENWAAIIDKALINPA